MAFFCRVHLNPKTTLPGLISSWVPLLPPHAILPRFPRIGIEQHHYHLAIQEREQPRGGIVEGVVGQPRIFTFPIRADFVFPECATFRNHLSPRNSGENLGASI